MTITLDTETSTRIVNNERKMYAHEVDGMQREKKVLLNGQPYNNALLLGCNIVMAGLFFYVTSLNASSVLPPEVAWAQPLVGGVSALGAGSLMYGTNAIAYKLPTITDRKTAVMMWTVWLAMLIISAITSAFLALLLVNGADSKLDTARMSMEQAGLVAGVETASVATATTQLDTWAKNNAAARADRSQAATRLETVEADYAAWRKKTMLEYGQGSEIANRRLLNENHYEHAPHVAAVKSAKANLKRFAADVVASGGKVDEWTGKLETAENTQRIALNASKDSTVTTESPWEETMNDMASMMKFFGLHFTGGAQFKATFAVFFALVLTLAPPFWSYQTGASVAPEVNKQAARMTEIDDRAKEMRQSGASGAGGAAGGAFGDGSGYVPSAVPEEGASHSETESMGNMVDLAMGIADVNPMLPCGLKQEDYNKYYRSNFDKVQRILDDAENKMLSHTGEIALKKKYSVGPSVAKMLKHVLVLENFGEYAADGAVILFNPAEG